MALFSCAGRGAREIGWREWEGCPQGVHRKYRKPGECSWRFLRKPARFLVCGEPGQEATFEFLRGSAVSAAVVGVGDFPELSVGIARVDQLRMTDWNVAVDLAVNQENRNVCPGDGIFGRDFLHVEAVLKAGAQESDLDEGAEDGAAYPGTEVERLSHAVVGDLAKIGERGFGGDSAEVRVGVEGL